MNREQLKFKLEYNFYHIPRTKIIVNYMLENINYALQEHIQLNIIPKTRNNRLREAIVNEIRK